MYSHTAREIQAAVVAATRESQRLKTTRQQRVDIFTIIEEAGIWLLFEDLQSLYGYYVRAGDSIGIALNAKHPLYLQRSTAAHEYGHHVLNHAVSFDKADQIEPGRPTDDPKELAAQTFAAHFLMPLQLVNATLLRMGLTTTPSTMMPQQAYRFALELGVSYAAAVSHLMNVKKITPAVARSLREVEPRDIKTLIGQGARPADSWADVWVVDKSSHGHVLYPRVNDEIHVSLEEDTDDTTAWILTMPINVDLRGVERPIEPSAYDADFGLLRDDIETIAHPPSVGRPQYIRRLVYQVLRSGRTVVRLEQRSVASANTPRHATVELSLETSPKRTGMATRGLSIHQR
jgi:Zn-dependent peptidase ImmA (M78 family)